jgi:hypothetical protein
VCLIFCWKFSCCFCQCSHGRQSLCDNEILVGLAACFDDLWGISCGGSISVSVAKDFRNGRALWLLDRNAAFAIFVAPVYVHLDVGDSFNFRPMRFYRCNYFIKVGRLQIVSQIEY